MNSNTEMNVQSNLPASSRHIVKIRLISIERHEFIDKFNTLFISSFTFSRDIRNTKVSTEKGGTK